MATTEFEPRLLVDAEELAKLTGWSKQSIYRRARRGELPVVRTGARQVRFNLASVRLWMDANTDISPRGQR